MRIASCLLSILLAFGMAVAAAGAPGSWTGLRRTAGCG